jgi:putative ABC transport system ATP-binding protein
MLELEDLVKHFHTGGEDVAAVDGVTLTAHGGEMVALHGPSGSGKTTLLLLIAALLRADRGSIRFEGRELSRLSEAQAAQYLHADVGFIYQSSQLMPRVSVVENAAMKLMVGGLSMRQAKARALPWLHSVGLGERLAHTPEQLSSGERQRVAIARALAGGPRLVLADEPTGNLDSVRSAETVELLRQVAHERGAVVLLVTHDLEAATVADRRCVLRDGKLLEQAEGRAAPAGGATRAEVPAPAEAAAPRRAAEPVPEPGAGIGER